MFQSLKTKTKRDKKGQKKAQNMGTKEANTYVNYTGYVIKAEKNV